MEKGKEKVATAWLSNPIIVWGGGFIAVMVLGNILLPSAFGGLYGSLKRTFSDAVDAVFGFVTDIVGAPESQDVNKRSAFDSVRGLVVPGDRALSDLADVIQDNPGGGNLTDYAKRRQQEEIAKGILLPDGSVNPNYKFNS